MHTFRPKPLRSSVTYFPPFKRKKDSIRNSECCLCISSNGFDYTTRRKVRPVRLGFTLEITVPHFLPAALTYLPLPM